MESPHLDDTMATRVMLLMLAVGLFMAIWSEDQHRPKQQRAKSIEKSQDTRSANRSQPSRTPAVLEALHSEETVTQIDRQEFGVVSSETVAGDNDWSNVDDGPLPGQPIPIFLGPDAGIPLPGEITPGDYRIVRSDGHVRHYKVTATELKWRGIEQKAAPRNLYLLHDGRMRWYFIRVEKPGRLVKHCAPRLPVAEVKPEPAPAGRLDEWVLTVQEGVRDLQRTISESTREARETVMRWALVPFEFRAMVSGLRGLFDRRPERLERLSVDPGDERR